jgi:hypothetical protein
LHGCLCSLVQGFRRTLDKRKPRRFWYAGAVSVYHEIRRKPYAAFRDTFAGESSDRIASVYVRFPNCYPFVRTRLGFGSLLVSAARYAEVSIE